MTHDTPHRASSGRRLAAGMAAGLAALALAAGPLADAAQEPPPSGYPQAAEDAGVYAADAADTASSVNDYPASAAESQDASYGYFRVVQGQATDAAASGERAGGEVNQPVLAGDRIDVPRGSRIEIVLPDHNLLRLDGGSEVVLERLAGSADAPDGETRLRLVAGNLQLVVDPDALGEQLPRIDTANASVYVNYPGAYRVTANARDWTSLVVRRGTADLATERGTATVRADQEAVARGERDAEAAVRAAGAWDSLELWGRQLSDQVADVPYVDRDLRYSASSLAQYGSWIDVGGTEYWRPRVDTGWRPYWHGRWIYTPSGLTWVAYEPWGWVPYHYGTWDYLPAYGWVWAPGYVYSPAWVYWYWGPSYTGWCPIGYYTGFYRRHFLDPGFRFGVYGWAGGDWGFFSRWSFVGAGYFGHRDLDHWIVPGFALRDRAHLAQLPQGIITTDTRGITPNRWGHPREVLSILQQSPAGRGGRLPDVTPFIARDPRLPTNVLHAIATDGPAKGRLTGTPLRPATLRGAPEPGLRSPRAVAGLPAPRTGRQPGQLAPRAGSPANGQGIGRRIETNPRTGRPTITVPPRQGSAPPAGRAPGDWRERADRERPASPARPRIVIPPGSDRSRPPATAPRGSYAPQPRYAPPAAAAPREIYRPAPRLQPPAAPPPNMRQPPPAVRQAPAPPPRAPARPDRPDHP
jgi:FecR protein